MSDVHRRSDDPLPDDRSIDKDNAVPDTDSPESVETKTDAANQSSEKPDHQRSGRPLRSALVSLAIGLLLITAVNLPFQFESLDGQTPSSLRELDFEASGQNALPVMAGWPTQYLISYSDSGFRRFSLYALIRNVSFLFVPVVLFSAYVYRRQRKVDNNARFTITIADLLILAVFLAAPFSWYQIKSRQAAEIEKQTGRFRSAEGRVVSTTWLPSLLRDRLPEKITRLFKRPRYVRLEHPTAEQVRLAVQSPFLVSLRLGGGNYDMRMLDDLVNRPHLRDLRIAGREIDVATIQLISQLKHLRSLNLVRTNVSAEAVNQLDLPNLQSLSLTNTDLDLSQLASPAWTKSIETLRLPHPNSGVPQSIVIDGWPKLRELTINEFEGHTETSPMVVTVANLPNLTTLSLDQFQKFDLTLRDLPKLKSIEGLAHNWELRIPAGGSLPAGIWLQRFDGQNLPELQDVNLYCRDMQSFLIRGAPKVESLVVSTERQQMENYAFNIEENKTVSIKREHAAQIINGIGDSDGPASVVLDFISLGGVDLSPLAKNKKLRSLSLANSKTSIKDWETIADMKWLQNLRISGNAIENENEIIHWALQTFPNLVTLDCQTASDRFITRYEFGGKGLELVGHRNLRSILFGHPEIPFDAFPSVKIIDMPNLELPLTLAVARNVEIKNSPNIRGFAAHGQVPGALQIDSLAGAEFFAVGGPQVDDQTIAPIQNSQGLKTLTLAHTSVSATALGSLPLGSIENLFLPGTAVDDDVVAKWPTMNNLRNLDLRNTKITGKSLAKLVSSQFLQSIRLDGCDIDPSAAVALGNNHIVSELTLSGIQVDPATLVRLLDEPSLRVLDISGTTIDKTVLDKLANPQTNLEFLGMQDCEFDPILFRKIIRSNRKLVFDLPIGSLDTRTLVELEGRLMSRKEFVERKQMQSMMRTGFFSYSGAPRESIIDTDVYAMAASRPQNAAPVQQRSGIGRVFQTIFGGPAVPPTPGTNEENADESTDKPTDGAAKNSDPQTDGDVREVRGVERSSDTNAAETNAAETNAAENNAAKNNGNKDPINDRDPGEES